MRTSGKGNDILMLLVPGGVLVFFMFYMFGGPAQFFGWLNTAVGGLVDSASSLF